MIDEDVRPSHDASSPRAIVVAGTGRYGDPWHPFVATSRRLVEILRTAGFDVRFSTDVDAALASLAREDLLVVNAGDPWRNGETGRGAPADSLHGLDAALDRGIGVLAVHNAVSSLRDYPRWRSMIGGDWIPGVSGHPPFGDALVRLRTTEHPVVDVLPGVDERGVFELQDERYTHLVVDDDVLVLADHRLEDDASSHPVLWMREEGPNRVVYDALGHDERSFVSEAHVEILRRAARWAARAD